MKFAEKSFEELQDAFLYCVRDYLHDDLLPASLDDAYYVLGAAAFLIDNLFAKENAGLEVTQITKNNLTGSLDPKKLSSMATKIRLALEGEDFQRGKSQFRDYLNWISESEEVIQDAYADMAGRLVLVTADELTSIVCSDLHQVEPMRIAELMFIVIGSRFDLVYRELFGPRFMTLKSIAFFLDLEDQGERIRSELAD